MSLPLGLKIKGNQLVCRLNKSIYGLKQANRQWFSKLSYFISSHGYIQYQSDHSLFTKTSGSSFTVILVYVDDLIMTGTPLVDIKCIKKALDTTF